MMIMKKLFLLAALLLASAAMASAQYKTYYVVEEVGSEYSAFGRFKIDWGKKLFFLESDSEKENDGRIKNYKENGNTRTFEVWSSATGYYDEKIYSISFVTEGEGKYSMTLASTPEFKREFKLSEVEPVSSRGKEEKSAEEPASLKSKINSKVGSVKDAIGKGVNKGLDALKNKKKEK